MPGKVLSLMERAAKKRVALRQVARKTGIKYPTVRSHHVLGHVPSLRFALKYAKFYGCTPESILKSFGDRAKVEARRAQAASEVAYNPGEGE